MTDQPRSPQRELTPATVHMSKAQRDWCREYKRQTGFEALMDDFLYGNETFVEAAHKSNRWFEDWSGDALLNITRNIPGEFDE